MAGVLQPQSDGRDHRWLSLVPASRQPAVELDEFGDEHRLNRFADSERNLVFSQDRAAAGRCHLTVNEPIIQVESLSKRYILSHRGNASDGLRHRIEDFARSPLQ